MSAVANSEGRFFEYDVDIDWCWLAREPFDERNADRWLNECDVLVAKQARQRKAWLRIGDKTYWLHEAGEPPRKPKDPA
jgi:hypothetical protein